MSILDQLFQMGTQFSAQTGFDKLFEQFGQMGMPSSDRPSAGMGTPSPMTPGTSQGQQPGFGDQFANILNDPLTQLAMKNIGQPGQQGGMSGMPQAQPGLLGRGLKTALSVGAMMLPPPFNIIGSSLMGGLGGGGLGGALGGGLGAGLMGGFGGGGPNPAASVGRRPF